MSLIYLLDTNTISEPMKPIPNKQLTDKIEKYHSQIALSIFTVYELIKGAYLLPNSQKRLRILRYVETTLSQLPVLLYTKESAIWHGKETARLQQLGKPPSFIDAQIAAVAYSNQLVLVTRNVSDFQYFSDLTVENWF
jgi:tRNA(fMet)-specific endonuclease VapC